MPEFPSGIDSQAAVIFVAWQMTNAIVAGWITEAEKTKDLSLEEISSEYIKTYQKVYESIRLSVHSELKASKTKEKVTRP